MEHDDSVLIVSDIQKSYGSNKVLKGVSFDVKQGEIFTILGPNGAGKTTLLKIIEQLIPKDKGSIELFGINPFKYKSKAKLLIGAQLQRGGFYPKLTLVKQLNFISSLYGVTVNPREYLERVNLWWHRKKYVEQLSGGLRQRFAICAALVHRPKLLILDEPTAALDVHERYNIWDLVFSLKEQGMTIILTTHYMREAQTLSDRLIILDNGVVKVIGRPQELIELLAESNYKPRFGSTLSIEDVYVSMTRSAYED